MINLGFLTSYPKFILNINCKKLKNLLCKKVFGALKLQILTYQNCAFEVYLCKNFSSCNYEVIVPNFLNLVKKLDITAADKLLKFHTGNFQRWYVSLVCAFFPEERIFLIVFHDNCMHIICKTRKKRTSKRLLFFSMRRLCTPFPT